MNSISWLIIVDIILTLDDARLWHQIFESYFGKFGDAILTENVFYECKNRSDLNTFYHDLLKVLASEFLAIIDNSVSSTEILDA